MNTNPTWAHNLSKIEDKCGNSVICDSFFDSEVQAKFPGALSFTAAYESKSEYFINPQIGLLKMLTLHFLPWKP